MDVTFFMQVFMRKIGFGRPIFLRHHGFEGLNGHFRAITPKIGGRPPKKGGVLPPNLGVNPQKCTFCMPVGSFGHSNMDAFHSYAPSIEAYLGGHYSPSFEKPPNWVDFRLWLWWKNLGQGLGFCNFRPGKLPHTGAFTSVRRDLL